jgi:hypothetical protein
MTRCNLHSENWHSPSSFSFSKMILPCPFLTAGGRHQIAPPCHHEGLGPVIKHFVSTSRTSCCRQGIHPHVCRREGIHGAVKDSTQLHAVMKDSTPWWRTLCRHQGFCLYQRQSWRRPGTMWRSTISTLHQRHFVLFLVVWLHRKLSVMSFVIWSLSNMILFFQPCAS